LHKKNKNFFLFFLLPQKKNLLFHHVRLLHTNSQNHFKYKTLVSSISFVFSCFPICVSQCNVYKIYRQKEVLNTHLFFKSQQ
jgi:hypothetical protein